MCEITFGHEIVHLNNSVNIRAMDRNGNPHDHVLCSFGDASVGAKEVQAFESLEPETRRLLA